MSRQETDFHTLQQRATNEKSFAKLDLSFTVFKPSQS